jgi:hypothetical protein
MIQRRAVSTDKIENGEEHRKAGEIRNDSRKLVGSDIQLRKTQWVSVCGRKVK